MPRGFRSPPPLFFQQPGFMRHLKHRAFATGVHIDSNSDRWAQTPRPKIAQIPTKLARDRRTETCVGLTVKGVCESGSYI